MKTEFRVATLLVSLAIAGCASMEIGLDAPDVSLRDVSVGEIGTKRQTFLLNFDVSNPNPFPLPISSISYGVELDGQRFASGEAPCSILVPAGGDGNFEISVDLNLLQTAPQLLFVVRDAARRDIPYRLEGRMALDIPLSPSVQFADTGSIQLSSLAY